MTQFIIKYKNAIVRMHGHYDRDRVAEAAMLFMRKAHEYKRSEEIGNKHSSRSIEKQQVLDQ